MVVDGLIKRPYLLLAIATLVCLLPFEGRARALSDWEILLLFNERGFKYK